MQQFAEHLVVWVIACRCDEISAGDAVDWEAGKANAATIPPAERENPT